MEMSTRTAGKKKKKVHNRAVTSTNAANGGTEVLTEGSRRLLVPQYPPAVWNQYATAIRTKHRTNNVSEG